MSKYRPQLLVVEDDPASQDMLVRRLASRGFRVATVSDGEAALKFVDSSLPDLILLDINLPGVSGLEVLKRIRESYTRDQLPVILVTALADSDDVVKGLEAGANDYIAKPINFSVLLARTQVFLQIKQEVSLLMEAERQRALIQALGEACHQLAQPMQAVIMTLDGLIHVPPDDRSEISRQLKEVLRWCEEVGKVIHRMQNVATLQPVSFMERMNLFEPSPLTQGERPV
jgi:DNA-binding response OmpR family regulator